MLNSIAIVLLILWLLGLVTGTTLGGFIHVLLMIAVVIIVMKLIAGPKPGVRNKKVDRAIPAEKTWTLK
jgi:hypothetical protein